MLNYCPGSADSGVLAAIAGERDRLATLQAEYDDVVRQTELKRQACLIQKPPAEPKPQPKPPEPKPPEPKPVESNPARMTIPSPLNKAIREFVRRRWRAHKSSPIVDDNGKDTGATLQDAFCFNADGTGTRTMQENPGGPTCAGAIRAHVEGDKLIIDADKALCDDERHSYRQVVLSCIRAANGEARCDWTPVGETQPVQTGVPFTRIDQPQQTPPEPKLSMPSTLNKDNLDFVKGCWRRYKNLPTSVDGKDMGESYRDAYCFKPDGTGTRTIRLNKSGLTCDGAIRAHVEGDKLLIDADEARCDDDRHTFDALVLWCVRTANGEARCDKAAKGETPKGDDERPLTRIDQP